MSYKRIQPTKLSGNETFTATGSKQFTVLDFWRYSFSVLNDNILRGRLAEFLVEAALKDLPDVGVRTSWGDFDVEDFDGTKIEVKCSAYIQDYDQDDFSSIRFSGLKAKEVYYSGAVKPYSDLFELAYKADVYVLALQHHKEHSSFDILDMNQWSFYILTRSRIAQIASDSKSVSMGRLIEHDVVPVAFTDISATIRGMKVAMKNE
jgi:hypothetical protein